MNALAGGANINSGVTVDTAEYHADNGKHGAGDVTSFGSGGGGSGGSRTGRRMMPLGTATSNSSAVSTASASTASSLSNGGWAGAGAGAGAPWPAAKAAAGGRNGFVGPEGGHNLQLQRLPQQQQAHGSRRQQQLQQAQAAQNMAAYPLPVGLVPPPQQAGQPPGSERQQHRGFVGGGGGALAADGGDRAALGLLFQLCNGQLWLRQAGWNEEAEERHGVAWALDLLRATKLELGSNRLSGENDGG